MSEAPDFPVQAIVGFGPSVSAAAESVAAARAASDFCTADGGTGEAGSPAPSAALRTFTQVAFGGLKQVDDDMHALAHVLDEVGKLLSSMDEGFGSGGR